MCRQISESPQLSLADAKHLVLESLDFAELISYNTFNLQSTIFQLFICTIHYSLVWEGAFFFNLRSHH